jgi:lactoylglutathione lyase
MMELGAFSVSLAVQDIAASKAFYEKLGFTAFAGDPSQNWLITEADESSTGPASFVIADPDGNPILVDKHV